MAQKIACDICGTTENVIENVGFKKKKVLDAAGSSDWEYNSYDVCLKHYLKILMLVFKRLEITETDLGRAEEIILSYIFDDVVKEKFSNMKKIPVEDEYFNIGRSLLRFFERVEK